MPKNLKKYLINFILIFSLFFRNNDKQAGGYKTNHSRISQRTSEKLRSQIWTKLWFFMVLRHFLDQDRSKVDRNHRKSMIL